MEGSGGQNGRGGDEAVEWTEGEGRGKWEKEGS